MGDVVQILDSARIPNEKWTTTGVPYLRSSDLSKGNLDGELKILPETYDAYRMKTGAPEKGDMLFISGGLVGYPYYKDSDEPLYVQGGSILYAKTSGSDSLDGKFLKTQFETPKFQYYVDNAATGITLRHFTLVPAKAAPISVPELNEQSKVANFFEGIDNLIAANQRKVDDLQKQKNAYLERIFNQSLRFSDFTEPWVQRKVSDVANRYDNLRVPITASDRVAGSTPYYGANGIQDFVEGFTHEGEFILVAEDGANDLQNYPVQYVQGKVWVNNHAHVLQAKQDVADNKFLMNELKNINIEPFLVGGGRAKLNADVLMKLPISLPDVQEQRQIGKMFDSIDKLIAANQRKVDLLTAQKSAYLQKMFI